jgi:hypothetical protein
LDKVTSHSTDETFPFGCSERRTSNRKQLVRGAKKFTQDTKIQRKSNHPHILDKEQFIVNIEP